MLGTGLREVVADGSPALGSAEWVAAFLLSPGVAGLAAVLAAVLGLVAARARIRADATRTREDRIRAGAALKDTRAAQVADRDTTGPWSAARPGQRPRSSGNACGVDEPRRPHKRFAHRRL